MKHLSTVRRVAAAATVVALGTGVLLAPTAAEAKPKPKPLKGSVTKTVPMTCTIFTTAFEYDAKITLSGVRASKTAKPVSLTAKFSAMPGIAPLALDYDTAPKLALKVGSAKATLKGKGHIDIDANQPVPVAPVKGSAKVPGSSLAVKVTKFDYQVLTADGVELTTIPCAPTGSGSMGKLTLK